MFNPLLYLLSKRQFDRENISIDSSELLKMNLKSTVIAGGNETIGILLSKHFTDKKVSELKSSENDDNSQTPKDDDGNLQQREEKLKRELEQLKSLISAAKECLNKPAKESRECLKEVSLKIGKLQETAN